MGARHAVTLIEMLVVIILIGILGSVAVINYSLTKERALDNDAFANLKLLQLAQKSYFMDNGVYYPSCIPPCVVACNPSIAEINQNLKASLSNKSWEYKACSNGCSRATRNGGDGRIWDFRINDDGSDPNDCAKDGEPNNATCYNCPNPS